MDNLVFFTCGDWDFKTALPKQLELSKLKNKKVYKRWCNIKKEYKNLYNWKPSSLISMLTHLGMVFEGRQHSGIDDSINTGKILERMVVDGYVIKQPSF